MATLQLFQHPEHVKISIFPITLSQQKYFEKLKFLHVLDVGKFVTLLLQNYNVCAFQILSQNRHIPHLSAKKIFENSLNTFEDIAFLLGQCNRKN